MPWKIAAGLGAAVMVLVAIGGYVLWLSPPILPASEIDKLDPSVITPPLNNEATETIIAQTEDDKEFRKALSQGTIVAIENYLKRYSRHAEEAKQQLAVLLKKATAEAAHPSKVAVMVRTTRGRDKEHWFKPGEGKRESFQDCIDSGCNVKGPEMVVVPKGRFDMGSNDGADDEKPVHPVTIGKPFAVGQFEITWDEWDACVTDGGCNNEPVEKAGGDNGWGKSKRTVVEVSWNDAKAYVKWLSKKTGKKYRLLSEAEWEYAARADTTTRYWWGDAISKDQANYGYDLNKTVPVDSYQPNLWGLYQVHGNVWEWVEDCWHKNYNGAPDDGTAWLKGGNCRGHVVRGGSWNDGFQSGLRSANRSWGFTGSRYVFIGFRIARTL
jgi:formylglycine-generating enzyme required for sulfatase activity